MVKGANGMSDGPASLPVVTDTASQGREDHVGLRQPQKSHPFPLGLPRNVFLEQAFGMCGQASLDTLSSLHVTLHKGSTRDLRAFVPNFLRPRIFMSSQGA